MPYPKGRGKTLDKKSGRRKGSTPWNKDKKYHLKQPTIEILLGLKLDNDKILKKIYQKTS